MNSHNIVQAPQESIEAATEVVRLHDVHRRFGTVSALDGVSLSVRQGEILGIIGRSGAGKSTLIRCLNGLERADSGDIIIDGRKINGLPERELQPLRRKIGMIFQHFNLLSAKTVEANVALPLKIEGMAKAERLARAREMLELVGLSDKAEAYPNQLSGGQKQRVGIARALAAKPALLLSDEATSALDPETTRSILALLKDINRKLGLTIVLITHEMDVIRAIADRVAVIDAGRIVEEGHVWSVFSHPVAEITKSLLAGNRPQLPEHISRTLDEKNGADVLISIDMVGAYAQSQLFNDLGASFSRGVRLLEGGVEHIQSQPVARFFLTVPRSDESLLRDITSKLVSAGARVEVLGYV
ncbi:D-methionine ABC transporter ATP-binding protein [Agrobacterium rubi TR3 = NBRC 13261]|uniref:Cell division ATP-binding protein FtsE n=1 Tax=Agrobacterium rubi TR3 = NBRC 13261 TaxID=1368415 RepID=A0A081D1I8_9HYPH|nr:methionine ABC transporter ATP-binding protein [Agrobacterium rubi]MBP1881267.1 D-methionine transport system ATP-binding protein [Agrobacterium rubi]GAK72784.1 D-methionine ABC transporter ATP-binding protein [Agrobacterium rubi TR3 = NBRC 13261]